MFYKVLATTTDVFFQFVVYQRRIYREHEGRVGAEPPTDISEQYSPPAEEKAQAQTDVSTPTKKK